jgi:DNA polymerase-1
MFVADEGKVLISADLSQAEARVVAYLARCEKLIQLFESGGDIHKENAIRFFGQYDEEKRLAVKRIVHGSNYGEGPQKIVQVAAADGIKLELRMVEAGQEAYFSTYPEIKEIWWEDVRRELKASRTLVTPLGWKRQFYGRWDSVKFFNEALAFQPQSTVGVLTQMAMLEVDKIPGVEILLNVHDSILAQCDEDKAEEFARAIVHAMQIPIDIYGRTLVIPAEAKVGKNWGDASEDNPDGLKKLKL